MSYVALRFDAGRDWPVFHGAGIAPRGAPFAAGWLAAPLAACGALKIVYDLALWAACRKHPLADP